MTTLMTRMQDVVAELADRGIDQVALAKAAGVTKGTVTHWLTGVVKSMKLEYASGIEDAFGYSAIWLVLGKGRKRLGEADKANTASAPSLDLETSPDTIAVRRVIFKISAGIAGFSVEHLDNGEGVPLFFSSTWAAKRGLNPADLYATRVSGDSMEPGLHDGDTIIINTGDKTHEKGAVFAVNHDGEFTVKRLRYELKRWYLFSDNPDMKRYPPVMCGDATYILGRVVLSQSESL